MDECINLAFCNKGVYWTDSTYLTQSFIIIIIIVNFIYWGWHIWWNCGTHSWWILNLMILIRCTIKLAENFAFCQFWLAESSAVLRKYSAKKEIQYNFWNFNNFCN